MSARYWSPGAAGPVLAAEREPDWRERSACKRLDPNLFFPPDGESSAGKLIRESKAAHVCAACPVRAECLSFAMRSEAGNDWQIRAGVFGGLNERERWDLERRGEIRPRRPVPVPKPSRAPKVPKPSRPARPPRPVPVIPDFTAAELALFRAKTRSGGCGTEWAASLNKDGFGLFRPTTNSPRVAAHRLAYKLATGFDPGADHVLQTCGNRRCLTEECLTAVPRHMRGRPHSRAA